MGSWFVCVIAGWFFTVCFPAEMNAMELVTSFQQTRSIYKVLSFRNRSAGNAKQLIQCCSRYRYIELQWYIFTVGYYWGNLLISFKNSMLVHDIWYLFTVYADVWLYAQLLGALMINHRGYGAQIVEAGQPQKSPNIVTKKHAAQPTSEVASTTCMPLFLFEAI